MNARAGLMRKFVDEIVRRILRRADLLKDDTALDLDRKMKAAWRFGSQTLEEREGIESVRELE